MNVLARRSSSFQCLTLVLTPHHALLCKRRISQVSTGRMMLMTTVSIWGDSKASGFRETRRAVKRADLDSVRHEHNSTPAIPTTQPWPSGRGRVDSPTGKGGPSERRERRGAARCGAAASRGRGPGPRRRSGDSTPRHREAGGSAGGRHGGRPGGCGLWRGRNERRGRLERRCVYCGASRPLEATHPLRTAPNGPPEESRSSWPPIVRSHQRAGAGQGSDRTTLRNPAN